MVVLNLEHSTISYYIRQLQLYYHYYIPFAYELLHRSKDTVHCQSNLALWTPT